MLTLEKDKKANKIFVTFKPRVSFWSKDFAIAISIALFIHFIFLFLFKVDIGILTSFLPSQPVVKVSSETPKAFVDIQEQKIEVPDFLLFQRNAYSIPHKKKFSLPEVSSSSFHLVENKENKILGPFKAQLHVSQGLKVSLNQSLLSEFPTFASLEFKAFKGKLLWINWIEKTGNSALDLQIENIIKEITLEDPRSSWVTGIIDFNFSIPNS